MWFFRDPGFMPGYAVIFPETKFPDDGTVAMLMASLLFVLPGERPEFLGGGGASEDEEEGGEVLNCFGGEITKKNVNYLNLTIGLLGY